MIDDSVFRKYYAYPWASDCYLKQCVVRKSAVQTVCFFFGCTLTSNSVSDCSSHAYAISRAAMAIVLRR